MPGARPDNNSATESNGKDTADPGIRVRRCASPLYVRTDPPKRSRWRTPVSIPVTV